MTTNERVERNNGLGRYLADTLNRQQDEIDALKREMSALKSQVAELRMAKPLPEYKSVTGMPPIPSE